MNDGFPHWLDPHAPDSYGNRQQIVEAIEQRYSSGPYTRIAESPAWRDVYLVARSDGQLVVWENGGALPLPPSVLAVHLDRAYPGVSERSELPPGTPPSVTDCAWSAHYNLDLQRQHVYFDQLISDLPSHAAARFPLSRPDHAGVAELLSARVEIEEFQPCASRAYLRATLRTRMANGRCGQETITTLLNFPVLSRDGTFNNRGKRMQTAVDELAQHLQNTLAWSLRELHTRFAGVPVKSIGHVSLDELFNSEVC